jgi:acyl-CoA thioester hydrolase
MAEVYAAAEAEIEIPFHDVDLMRVTWHGHYAKYLEIARSKLFDSIAYNVPEMEESGYAWPIIEMKIRYAQPLRFKQKVLVSARLVEIENRMKINYELLDAEGGKRIARAHTIQVALRISSGEMLFASPRVLYEKLGL